MTRSISNFPHHNFKGHLPGKEPSVSNKTDEGRPLPIEQQPIFGSQEFLKPIFSNPIAEKPIMNFYNGIESNK